MKVLDDDLELISEEEDDEVLASQCISSSNNNNIPFDIIVNNDDIIESPVKQNIREIIQPDQIYEQISDDETDIQLNKDNDVVMNDKSSSTRPRVSKHQTRSLEARRKLNHKRNETRRKRRYRYSIKRRYYYQFKMYLIRKILKQYNINCTHVRINEDASEDELEIGLKDRSSKVEAKRRLAYNIFNKRGYYHYRRLYRH
jgi:hypothetical protein